MAHTPGPWTADTTHPERTLYMVWARDLIIADVVDDQHDNAEANAHLIAAAPELLATLRFVLPVLERAACRGTIDAEGVNLELEAAREVQDAIAKAEGRSE